MGVIYGVFEKIRKRHKVEQVLADGAAPARSRAIIAALGEPLKAVGLPHCMAVTVVEQVRPSAAGRL